MLGFFFGFNMRLGRLHYFLSSLGLGVFIAAIVFSMFAFVFRNGAHGTMPSASGLLIPALFFILVVLWVNTSLMSMRIRDIGWNPAYVVPVWLLIFFVDAFVAFEIPAFGVRNGHQTIVGGLVNLGLSLALLFWPGSSYDSSTPTFSEPRRARTEPYTPPPPPPAPSASIARASSGRSTFGQRGR